MSSTFRERFRTECIYRSAIAPELFEAAIDFIEDLGRYETHEALGLTVAYQWQTRKPHIFGVLAVFRNEDGTVWQGKAEHPLIGKDGKPQKYQAPKDNGSRVFMPAVPVEIRRKIGQRYGIEVPETGSFWDWVAATPGLTLTHTEGGKKALSLLSDGYIAIALYGVNNGYRTKDVLKETIPAQLIEDVAALCHPDTTHIIAFDQDTAAKTRRRVENATSQYGRLLAATGGAVKVATWDGAKGKGIDDLAVAAGRAAVDEAIAKAITLKERDLEQWLERKLTTAASLRLNTRDLSTLEVADIPQCGVIGLVSAKATGKTKFIGTLTADLDKVALLGHRIALTRNVSDRLGLHYRGDLDKHQGRFIAGGGYTLKVATCVDSLLALNPESFRGCDLVIDEACQVLRHLLTSSTCNKEGKRPVLLARFTELVKVSRRVIVADADLDDATLDYIQQLRGDGLKPYLIRNDFKPEGYPVRFIEATDSSIILGELLKDVAAGLKILVATDSLGGSKAIARMIERLGIAPLLINSDTSGDELERAFITNPDANLDGVQVVIASPSMATGVSIERKHFDKVYGLFYGASSTDGDMAQALGRVRDNVPRVVWCAKHGRNFCDVSRSTVPFRLKAALKDRTDTTAALIRCGLRADMAANDAYDWQSDPHLNLWAKIEASKNRVMGCLRTALLVRLRHEGNEVTVIRETFDGVVRALLRLTRKEIKDREALALLNAEILTPQDAKRLDDKEALDPSDRLALARYHLCDFYAIIPHDLTLEQIAIDNERRFRTQLLNLENQLDPEQAIATDIRALERQTQWKRGVTPWDAGSAEIKRKVREMLGLDAFLNPERRWTKYDLDQFAQKCDLYRSQIKAALNYSFNDDRPIVQVLGELLNQLGLKTTAVWSRNIEGHQGEKLRVYRLNSDHWEQCQEILERRKRRRDPFGSHPPYNSGIEGVIQAQNIDIEPQKPYLLTLGARAIYAPDGSIIKLTRIDGGAAWAMRENDPLNTLAFPVSASDLRVIA